MERVWRGSRVCTRKMHPPRVEWQRSAFRYETPVFLEKERMGWGVFYHHLTKCLFNREEKKNANRKSSCAWVKKTLRVTNALNKSCFRQVMTWNSLLKTKVMHDRCRSNVTVRWHSYSSFRDDGSLSKDKGGRDSLYKVSVRERSRGRPAVCTY